MYVLVVCLFILTVVGQAFAQDQYFVDVTLPAASQTSYDIEAGDVDGDLDLDIIEANNGQNRLLINDGAGNFTDVTSVRLPSANDISFDADFSDVDGDGDLDIFIANRNSQNRLLINNGSGVFTDETASRLPADSDASIEGVFGDANGDGKPDILVINNDSQNRLLINNGSGVFTDETASRLPIGTYADNDGAFGDVDGDSDLDIVIGCAAIAGCQNRLLINDGTGVFADETLLRMPSMIDTSPEIELGISDVDGDGDLDIVVANGAGSGKKQNRLLINDGNGYFTEETSTRLPSLTDATFDIDLGDVDGDGDLDAVVSNDGERNRLLINNGSGVYSDQTTSRLPSENWSSREADFGDVDGDGDLDIIVANMNNQQNRLLINDGTGNFTEKAFNDYGLPADTDVSFDADFSDVDGDGDLDVFIANRNSQNKLLINDGSGNFADETASRLPADSDTSIEGVFGDADGDGKPDILVINNDSQNRLLINDGSGNFTDETASRLPIGLYADNDGAFGDVDGDSDLDIVIGCAAIAGCQNRLLINDGTGVFADETLLRMPSMIDTSPEIELGISDVDGDGDLDIVVANGAGSGQKQNRILINNGAGYFTEETSTRLPLMTDATFDIDLGDVDGDGDLDAIVANNGEQNRLLINVNGAGVFADQTATRLPSETWSSREADFGDVDGDGDLDVIVANMNNQQNHLLINDGTGVFTDDTAARLPIDADTSYDIEFGDVDGDGDLDAIVANNGQNRLYINMCGSCATPGGGGVLDTDSDGVNNDIDLCPGTPAGEPVDANGCSSSQLDDDGDGVMNNADLCPGTPVGAPVNANGCSTSQIDSDGDGVTDDIDLCPSTPSGEPIDTYGCSASQRDTDGDGVTDDIDLCPGTPAGESVDTAGCSASQLDDDGDGVMNNADLCPFTPAEPANTYGCSASQLDDDGDGVMNNADLCPGTPVGEAVDVDGCSASQLDDDGDGVMNNADLCPGTPAGEAVNADGCSLNTPPVADADTNITLSSEEILSATIQGHVTDPDGGDTIQYRWRDGENVLLTWAPAGINGECPLDLSTLSLGIGTHILVLEVTDGHGISSDSMILTIDNSAPHASSGGGIYEIGSSVTLGGDVSDFDGDSLSYEWKEGEVVYCTGTIDTIAGGTPVILPDCVVSALSLGSHIFSLQINDGANNPVSSEISVEVIDTAVPTLAPVASEYILWPPNHKMEDITIEANAADNSGQPVTLHVVVTSDEPDEGLGDGDQPNDIVQPTIDQDTGTIHFRLRVERSMSGDGRVYTVEITATDSSNNSSVTEIELLVPYANPN